MDGTTLLNRGGITLTGNWLLPTAGTPGTIQNTVTNMYLSVKANATDGSDVDEEALDVIDTGQQWEIGAVFNSGYFSIRNIATQKFLIAHTPNKLSIEGIKS